MSEHIRPNVRYISETIRFKAKATFKVTDISTIQ